MYRQSNSNYNNTDSGANRRRPRKRARRRNAPIQQQLALGMGPTRFPPLPNISCVSLCNTDYFGAAGGTSELIQTLGLVEFLGYRPLYALEYYAIYKYARVISVDVEINAVNIGTNPVEVAVCNAAYNDVSGLTMDRLKEKPNSVFKLMSPSGGMDRATFRKRFVASELLGVIPGSKYWVDVTQSASATPIDVREPVLVLALDNYQSSGTAFSAQVNWKMTYHIEWFDPKTPASS